MKFCRVQRVIILILAIMLTACSRHPHPASLATELDTLVASFATDPSLGVVIENLQTKQILYQKDPQRTFFPASTTKSIVAVVALKYLGPNFKFSTNISTDGKNLYLHFTGDPTLTYADLQKLLSTLQEHHIKDIKGNIYIDTYPFNGYKPATGFMWDDNNFYFSAPNDGVVLNGNAFTFYLWPGSSINSKAVVKPVDSLTYTPVNNEVFTQLAPPSTCYPDLNVDMHNHYQLTGCIPYNNPAMRFGVAVDNPTYLLTQYLTSWLAQHHIKLAGHITTGRTPANTKVLAVNYSVPLAQIISTMLYRSDNLYANTIFLTIGALYENSPVTWENAQHAFKSIMKNTMNVDTSHMTLIDGAGLSRYNQYSPLLLLSMTEYAYNHPDIGDVYFPALAPYTRYNSLKDVPFAEYKAKFNLKTGSMTGVAAITGYLVTEKETPLGVVVMLNGDAKRQELFGLNAQILTRLLRENL